MKNDNVREFENDISASNDDESGVQTTQSDNFFDNMISFPFNHRISDTDFEWMLEITKKCIS